MEKSKQIVIDDSTPVRIGFVIIIVGAASWVTMIYAQALDNTDRIERLQSRAQVVEDRQSEMYSDIKVIRSILERESQGGE